MNFSNTVTTFPNQIPKGLFSNKMGEAPAPTQAKLAEEFMTSFSKKKNELLAGIESLSNDAKDVNERLNGISNEIQKLSKILHDAVLFLPSYSVKVGRIKYRD